MDSGDGKLGFKRITELTVIGVITPLWEIPVRLFYLTRIYLVGEKNGVESTSMILAFKD
jgi:hypothetical protein